MLRRLALAVGCALAFNAGAQGLFDDNEARRRIELLRAEVSENQRQVAEQLKKLEAALAGASDRSALIQLATQVETLSNEMARMRGQLEVLGNQAETADRRSKDLYLDIDTRLRKLEQTREQASSPDKPAAQVEAEASQGETRAYQAALDFGYLATSSSRVFCAARRSPMVSCELAMESIASGALSLSGQVLSSLRCAAIACL